MKIENKLEKYKFYFIYFNHRERFENSFENLLFYFLQLNINNNSNENVMKFYSKFILNGSLSKL